jgi:uncharacterized repeat protein (TIGR01451 family)
VGARGSRILIQLFAAAVLLGAAAPAEAANCSDFPGGLIDGFLGTPAPSQIQIDRNCTIRNYPASNPLPTNFSFKTQPGQTDERWLVIFDNVVHTGQMACNSVAGHIIWFTNGSSTSIQEGCQNLLIPVEKIDKQIPPGPPVASIGVPFTYTLTMPVLFDPGTGTVINNAGSVNDLHSATLTDDLNETGVDLTYVSHVAYWESSGTPVPHTFSNVGGLLTFDNFPIIPAGEQIVIELTVVLDATPTNTVGTQFINTARWDFGRLIDGVFYEPLPGENGISEPLTISAPDLVFAKTGPATLNLGASGDFTLDVQNNGSSDAWDVTILDQLPDGPSGGMCDVTPQVLSARVYAADGVTPVPGKGPLSAGSDFTIGYSGAPTCELTLSMLSADAAIGPTERLILVYRSQLDADTQDGATLTNVAGATEWFNGDATNPNRVSFTRTLTDGTVGTLDHQDAHTLTTALTGFFFEKSVQNLTTGVNPTGTADPGDVLRYTLRLQTTTSALNNVTFFDDLGELNATPVFVPGSLTLVGATIPPGADTSNTDPFGGTNSAGIVDIRNLSVPADSELSIQFDVTLDPTLLDGIVVTNQADLIDGVKIADSDDPNVNGQADPNVPGDEDPTQVVILSSVPGPLLKENTQPTASVGEAFAYRITVPAAPQAVDLFDVQITDDLTASAADLRFVSVSKIAGSGAWNPINTGTPTNLVIEDPTIGIDIPAGEQIVLEVSVVLEDTPTNVSGLSFSNTADFVINFVDGGTTPRAGQPDTTPPMTIVGPDDVTVVKTGPPGIVLGTPGTYRLNAQNIGTGPAWNLRLIDQLPEGPAGGTCDMAPSVLSVQVFEADAVTPVSGPLSQGTDYALVFRGAPDCELDIAILSPAGVVGATERLIVDYEALLDADSQNGVALTNVAGATEWFSADGTNPATSGDVRTFTRVLTDGTVGTLDHQDAHTTTTALPSIAFEKTVENVTTGQSPAASAMPGDTLRYTLRAENVSATPLADFSFRDDLDSLNPFAVFAQGTLTITSAPPGADTSQTNSSGGTSGTGLLDVRSLSLPNPGDVVTVVFEVQLAAVIPNGTLATNQSELRVGGATFTVSDDPGVNGPADPMVPGDEDPTVVPIVSAPVFQVEKISTDLTADPNVLLAGETLRYTITVENIGSANASDATLRDAVPANTSYVAGSTTLNGAAVPDGPGGLAPLAAGIPINAPGSPAGSMPADNFPGTEVATLTFDVVVDPAALDGTVISNQAFVSAVLGGVVDQPSDDPGTAVPDDPTMDVVGNAPLLFAPKSVVIGVDGGTLGIVDPLDVLHYTITVYNNGTIPATAATLSDAVPANTTWVADSLLLNGLPVGVPDGGVSPLAAGIDIASSDLAPPLPGAGVINPGENAVVEFDLQVDAATPAGTLISNQAVVGTAELANLLTDGDGDPSTGPEPTVVVVGAGQQLAITKQVTVVGGGPALAGGQLEYTVRVTNVASVDALDVVITDDLDAPVAGQLGYVPGSGTLDGLPAGVVLVGSVLTADWSALYGALAPGASAVLRFRADIAAGLPTGTTITNTGVVTWNAGTQTASDSISIDVGGVPGVGLLNGAVWHDTDFDDALAAGDIALQNWTVELLRNGTPVQSVLTDAAGLWSMAGVAPNDLTGDQYELRFSGPGATATSAALGLADSAFTNGMQQITDIIVPSGSNLQDLNLPIDPNGVVYNSLLRQPVGGAVLTMTANGSGTALPAACFDDSVQQGQVTRADGYYKFDLNFSDPACPPGISYEIAVSMPAGSGYEPGTSLIIPATSDGTTPPFDVPPCPGGATDAVIATGSHCEAQVSSVTPSAAASTVYHTHVVLDATSMPGTAALFNNHIPVDPVIFGNVAISKTTPSRDASRGDLVPYEITLRNDLAAPIPDLTLVDVYPPGFRYIEGSARVDGTPLEPVLDPLARTLTWTDLGLGGAETRKIVLLLAVGAGVGDGKFTNIARAISSGTGNLYAGDATATVRVVPDPTFACTDVIGKVFDDRNRNGAQDTGERGLAGVRLVTARGLVATTDPHGRFHITCAVVPNEDRGSNFILKLDDRSLPSGYRMSTRQTQVRRATQGKALRFNFGASVHRVVGLDVADAAFEPGTAEMREQWTPRLGLLMDELAEAPATLRLSYVADIEEPSLVDLRIAAIKGEVARRWRERDARPDGELEIESDVYWRRGAPVGRTLVPDGGVLGALAAPFRAGTLRDVDSGDAAEQQLPADVFTEWTQDPERLASDQGDQLEERLFVVPRAETIKLKGVVPPIRFASGVAEIPAGTVAQLRDVLDDMSELHNVRLHLVGHADSQLLSASLAAIYGDNEGLSRERAGEVAEYLQTALGLRPEAISFAFAGDSEPIASNATEAGRAQNRRVEVEVWYDELRSEFEQEEVVVEEEIKRVKVCRTETVCKLRYKRGHEKRARLRNLIAPLHIEEDTTRVPDDFLRNVQRALDNLSDKQNVTVKFVGYTDDAPLEGPARTIYGTHLAVSKARAHRVARAIQDRLKLSTRAVASDGRGSELPLASNETERGRALNRRVEVEFWYDDPLQQLPDEPQPCPDPGEAPLVTKVYDPPWGRLEPVAIENGEPRMPAGFHDRVRRALEEVDGQRNARVRFVGYTANERLDRRTAAVYGDDIGLSAARARRTMERMREALGLAEPQVEHEGRGYVHSNDVVNAGFLQGDTDHVAVQVVYDEPEVLDELEGLEITPITRELRPSDPLALNLMHITVDGQPIHDPARSSADIQRCTDVALDRADIRFRFDDLHSKPRLSVTSSTGAVAVSPAPLGAGFEAGEGAGEAAVAPEGEAVATTGAGLVASGGSVDFRMYTNYGHFIERSELRIFERGESTQAEPLAVIEVGEDGSARWQPEPGYFASPVRELAFVARAYDAEGRFDETAPQVLWLVHGTPAAGPAAAAPGGMPTPPDPLLNGYGETGALKRSIPLDGAGAVQVYGSGVPAGHTVWLAGERVPVDAEGNFVAEAVLPSGMHTVEVAVLDPAGNGELFLRDLELERDDWFYVGIADFTGSLGKTNGPDGVLDGSDSTFDRDSNVDGRLAFFLKGRFDGFGRDWGLTAHADTRESPVKDLFKDFVDKTPEALFRRLDTDRFYPTFGDDGTVEELAPTSGKFYAKLTQRENHAMWGNFKVGYLDNELAHVDRGLYGANVHYQTLDATSFGEQRGMLDGFAALPGTVPSREEFRGTGGSLYYLRVQDLLEGSERLRIEVRDKDSGLVTGVVHLQPAVDYDVDYLQGRILLAEPLSATADDDQLVRSQGLSGDEVWLVVQYEYTPGFTDLDQLAAGGQGHWWLNDFVRLGATASRNDDDNGSDSSLYAADVTLRKGTDSWLKLQYGRSKGTFSESLRSDDGGFSFVGTGAVGARREADGYRADLSVGFDDLLGGWWKRSRGRLSLYTQMLDAGYSAPGLQTTNDVAQYGGLFDMPISERLKLDAKADYRDEKRGLTTTAAEADLAYALTERWTASTGVRYEDRDDDSPVVPPTQEQGDRTDVVAQLGYDARGRWSAYGFGQGTVMKSGSQDANHRYGLGGAYRLSNRLVADGEVSHGKSGPALKLGTSFQETEETRRYLSYVLDNERGIDGLHERRGNLVSGMRSRLSDSSSVYLEDRYAHSDSQYGLSRAMGMTLGLTDRWSVAANWELGTLIDQQTSAETDRNAGGATVGYAFEDVQLSVGVEYRDDLTEQLDGSDDRRTTWLFRNNVKYQMTPDWRLLAKANHSMSDSSEGEFFDGGFTEVVAGAAFRPVKHDRLNALAKYTWFSNMPTTDQVGTLGSSSQFIQRSHVASLDVSYDLTPRWSIGGKYAYRRGEVALDRVNPDFFDNSAHLYILRTDYRFLKSWEVLGEGRMLDMPDLDERRAGALFTLYRYFGDHFKVGIGYNFTDFSEDLTDLSYDHHGFFFNVVGSL